MISRHVVFALLLATCLFGQTALSGQSAVPDTPAGKVFLSWLTAFNSGDPAQMRAFDSAHWQEGLRLEQAANFRAMTGGFALLRVEKSDTHSLTALLQERMSDTVARFEFSITNDDPPKIVKPALRAVPRPADLAISRFQTEPTAVAALATRIEELLKTDQFSGVIAIARNGKTVTQHAAGYADRASSAPVGLDTKFRLGSMNKMFTATATLQLVEAGKLKLDEPIGSYLTDYPNTDIASKVTVRHLLSHTGGTGDIFGPDFVKNRLTLREHADYLRLYGSRARTHEPGAEFRYSNYGYVLLGALIEKVSGMSYYDYVRTRIFMPSGMTATDSLPETDKVANLAPGYMRRDGSWMPNTETLPWRGTAAGGGYSTVGDLLRFAAAFQSGRLISREVAAEATTARQQSYGYGFVVAGEGVLRYFGHAGGAPGMNGELRIFPELGYVVVGLSNLDPPSASRVVDFFTLRMPAQ
jgi:D-alanyl-D-alanine carboxypeptidase